MPLPLPGKRLRHMKELPLAILSLQKQKSLQAGFTPKFLFLLLLTHFHRPCYQYIHLAIPRDPLSQSCCSALLEELLESQKILFSAQSEEHKVRPSSLLCLGAAQGRADTQLITSRLGKKQNQKNIHPVGIHICPLDTSLAAHAAPPAKKGRTSPGQSKQPEQQLQESLWATAPCSSARQTPGTARGNR